MRLLNRLYKLKHGVDMPHQMSAGTGIIHSEYNLEDEDTTLYQIWIEPKKISAKPSWATQEFPKEPAKDSLTLLVSGDGNTPLFINQDAYIYAGRLRKGAVINHPIKVQAYLLVSEGELDLDGNVLRQGDGTEIVDQESIKLKALTDTEVLVIDVPGV